MERSHECEGVILVPPLQFNEGFFLTHTASFTPRSNQFFLSVQDGYVIDINKKYIYLKVYIYILFVKIYIIIK